MNGMRGSLFSAAVVVAASAAMGDVTFTDTFSNGANPSGWTFNVTNPDVIEPSGGNPGAWLHNDFVVSFAPRATTTFGRDTPFHGDFRAAGVSSISVDARTDFASFTAEGRQFSIVLRDMNGTPNDFDDDDYAYYVGDLIPQVGQGWVRYEFQIPSQSDDPVPAGWSGGWSGDLENFRPGVEWSDVISSVERVEFWWLHPAFFAIVQDWDVGIDNVSITYVPEPATLGLLAAGVFALLRRR